MTDAPPPARRGPFRARVSFLAGVLTLLTAAGCAGALGRAPQSGDSRFGHRADGSGRETLLIRPAADSVGYLTYPAVIDSVAVRPGQRAVAPGESVAVDVLIKGALPDACSELDAIEQRRGGRQVTMTLTMRQPRETVCAQVVRPYRFYSVLPGLFEAGSYTLILNGRVHTFQVFEAAPGGDGP